jgi:hypothetical protein
MPFSGAFNYSKEPYPFAALIGLGLLAACAAAPVALFGGDRGGRGGIFRDGCNAALLADAENSAPKAGGRVLAQARRMTVEDREILPGACWDYINAVYDRAGFPDKERQKVFISKKSGPYAAASQILPGDWLYFINHSYHGVEHSSLFVAWADKGAMRAYMLSYPGEQRRETARYLVYDLSNVYQVIRPKG